MAAEYCRITVTALHSQKAKVKFKRNKLGTGHSWAMGLDHLNEFRLHKPMIRYYTETTIDLDEEEEGGASGKRGGT